MKILFKINLNAIYESKKLYVYQLIIKKITYNVNILHNVKIT
jgi:hypothetical protein